FVQQYHLTMRSSTEVFTLFLHDALPISGDLQELLGNLLENAFKWARSRVLLTVTTGESAPRRRPGLVLAVDDDGPGIPPERIAQDRKSTRLNSSHVKISYAVFCLKKKRE